MGALEVPEITLPALPEKCNTKYGNTWSVRKQDCDFNMTMVGCGANAGGKRCDPYKGDTLCKELRPILCIHKSFIPRPPYNPGTCSGCAFSSHPSFYYGWSEGIIKITRAIRGCFISSKSHADQICQREFGCGYQMASHSDGVWLYPNEFSSTQAFYQTWPNQSTHLSWGERRSGGWNFWGHNLINNFKTRFWVYINNQPGNCWN